MTKNMKNFTVTVPHSEIKRQLLMIINHPFKNQIVDAILGTVEYSEIGINAIYLAFSGMKITTELSVGQSVLVKWTDISTWRLDKAKTEEANPFKKGIYIPAKILGFEPHKIQNLHLEYVGMDSGGNSITTDSWVQQSNVLTMEEEFPFDDVDNQLSF